MSALVYICPVKKVSVQYWLKDELRSQEKDAYVGVACQACGKLHFLNPATGKLLGQK